MDFPWKSFGRNYFQSIACDHFGKFIPFDRARRLIFLGLLDSSLERSVVTGCVGDASAVSIRTEAFTGISDVPESQLAATVPRRSPAIPSAIPEMTSVFVSPGAISIAASSCGKDYPGILCCHPDARIHLTDVSENQIALHRAITMQLSEVERRLSLEDDSRGGPAPGDRNC